MDNQFSASHLADKFLTMSLSAAGSGDQSPSTSPLLFCAVKISADNFDGDKRQFFDNDPSWISVDELKTGRKIVIVSYNDSEHLVRCAVQVPTAQYHPDLWPFVARSYATPQINSTALTCAIAAYVSYKKHCEDYSLAALPIAKAYSGFNNLSPIEKMDVLKRIVLGSEQSSNSLVETRQPVFPINALYVQIISPLGSSASVDSEASFDVFSAQADVVPVIHQSRNVAPKALHLPVRRANIVVTDDVLQLFSKLRKYVKYEELTHFVDCFVEFQIKLQQFSQPLQILRDISVGQRITLLPGGQSYATATPNHEQRVFAVYYFRIIRCVITPYVIHQRHVREYMIRPWAKPSLPVCRRVKGVLRYGASPSSDVGTPRENGNLKSRRNKEKRQKRDLMIPVTEQMMSSGVDPNVAKVFDDLKKTFSVKEKAAPSAGVVGSMTNTVLDVMMSRIDTSEFKQAATDVGSDILWSVVRKCFQAARESLPNVVDTPAFKILVPLIAITMLCKVIVVVYDRWQSSAFFKQLVVMLSPNDKVLVEHQASAGFSVMDFGKLFGIVTSALFCFFAPGDWFSSGRTFFSTLRPATEFMEFVTLNIKKLLNYFYHLATGDHLFNDFCMHEKVTNAISQTAELIEELHSTTKPYPSSFLSRLVDIDNLLQTMKLEMRRTRYDRNDVIIINESLRELERHIQLARATLNSVDGRTLPVAVMLYGPPCKGKTTIMANLSGHVWERLQEICDEEGIPESKRCWKDRKYDPAKRFPLAWSSIEDNRFEGYLNQWCVDFGEIFVNRTSEKLARDGERLISLVDTSIYLPPMAFEGKGTVCFNSDLLLFTTNFDMGNLTTEGQQLSSPEAIMRRFHMCYRVERAVNSTGVESFEFILDPTWAKVVEPFRASGLYDQRQRLNYLEFVDLLALQLYDRKCGTTFSNTLGGMSLDEIRAKFYDFDSLQAVIAQFSLDHPEFRKLSLKAQQSSLHSVCKKLSPGNFATMETWYVKMFQDTKMLSSRLIQLCDTFNIAVCVYDRKGVHRNKVKIDAAPACFFHDDDYAEYGLVELVPVVEEQGFLGVLFRYEAQEWRDLYWANRPLYNALQSAGLEPADLQLLKQWFLGTMSGLQQEMLLLEIDQEKLDKFVELSRMVDVDWQALLSAIPAVPLSESGAAPSLANSIVRLEHVRTYWNNWSRTRTTPIYNAFANARNLAIGAYSVYALLSLSCMVAIVVAIANAIREFVGNGPAAAEREAQKQLARHNMDEATTTGNGVSSHSEVDDELESYIIREQSDKKNERRVMLTKKELQHLKRMAVAVEHQSCIADVADKFAASCSVVQIVHNGINSSFLHGFAISPNLMLINKHAIHQRELINEVRIRPYYSPKPVYYSWSEIKVHMLPSDDLRDIVALELPARASLRSKKLRNHFPLRSDRLHFKAVSVMRAYPSVSKTHCTMSFVAAGLASNFKGTCSGLNTGLEYNGHVIVNGCTGNVGDCMLPYVSTGESNPMIEGFHASAGAGCTSYFVPVYREDFDYFKSLAASVVTFKPDPVYVTEHAFDAMPLEPCVTLQVPPATSLIGMVKEEKSAYGKTVLRPSVFQRFTTDEGCELGPIVPVTKRPAKLLPFVNDRGEKIDPLLSSYLKFALSNTPGMRPYMTRAVSRPHKHFEAFFKIDDWARFFKEPQLLTWEQCIYGDGVFEKCDMTTADGYRLRQMKIKKSDITPGSDQERRVFSELDRLDARFRAGKPYWPINEDCLKDELRDLERVSAGKTRLFNVTDFFDQIIARKYVGWVMHVMKSLGSGTVSRVGVAPGTFDWDRTMNSFTGPVVAGDIAANDVTLPAYGAEVVNAFVQMLMCHKPGSPDFMATEGVIRGCAHALHIHRRHVYQPHGGNSSGNYLTSFYNTVVNYDMHRSVFKYLKRKYADSEARFASDVNLILYSDDNQSQSLRAWWTIPNVAEGFKVLFDMEYTMPDKTEVDRDLIPLNESTFLSRTFCPGAEGRAPLKMDSIHGMLLYYRHSAHNTPYEAMCQNVDAAFRELAHHTREDYDVLRDRVLERCRICGYVIYIPEWDAAQQRRMEGYAR